LNKIPQTFLPYIKIMASPLNGVIGVGDVIGSTKVVYILTEGEKAVCGSTGNKQEFK
jgi:hypothetical protein